jgi:predicted dehydrogenase
MNPVKVGVVGVGHVGSIHARIYAQLRSARLVAVCDIRPDRARNVAEALGCEAVTDYRKLMGKVEAVSIAVPTHLHYPIAQAFLAHGIHTLVEKPIAHTLRQADRLLKTAQSTRALLTVGHVERFNPALQKARTILTHPRFIEVHRLAPFRPRGIEVGVVLDLMIHDLDLLLWLIKAPIRRIEAVGVKVLTPFEDIANARILFANGAVANLTASRIARETMRKFRIFQPDAYVSIDLFGQCVDICRHRNRQIVHEHLTTQGDEPLGLELRAFIEAIRRRHPPFVKSEEARDALALALKITHMIRRTTIVP